MLDRFSHHTIQPFSVFSLLLRVPNTKRFLKLSWSMLRTSGSGGGMATADRKRNKRSNTGDTNGSPKKRARRPSDGNGNNEKPARFLRRDERRDLLTRAKGMWESLRPVAANDREKAKKLVRELHTLISGRLNEVVFRHDGSRIVQWILNCGDEDTKKSVLNEILSYSKIEGEEENENQKTTLFSRMVTDRYAKHLALKIMKNAETKQRTEMFDTHVMSHVPTLMKQIHSAHVLDTAYVTLLNAAGRMRLVLSILWARSPTPMVRSTVDHDDNDENEPKKQQQQEGFTAEVSKVTTEFRSAIRESAYQIVTALLEKESVLPLELVHAVVREWLIDSISMKDAERVRTVAASLASQLVHFTHTKPGLFVAITCIKVLDAKHRKKVVKSFKGHFRKLVSDEFGHRVVLTLLRWMDDTKLLGKAISTELCTTEVVLQETPEEADSGGQQLDGDNDNKTHGKSRGGLSRAQKKAEKLKNEEKKKRDGDGDDDEEDTDENHADDEDEEEADNAQNDEEEEEEEAEEGIDLKWLEQMCMHKHGRTILLYLLCGENKRYFNPEGYDLVWKRMDVDVFGETSKKDAVVRRVELCAYFTRAVRCVIRRRALCTRLLQSPTGGGVLVGAAEHEDLKDSVAKGIGVALASRDGVTTVCRSGVGRRVVAAVFKVGGKDIVSQIDEKSLNWMKELKGCEPIMRHIGN